jgi:spore germination protein GerM
MTFGRTTLVAVILVIAAGCGVPAQQQAIPIEPGAIPSQLSSPDRPTSPRASATPGRSTVQVNFVRKDRLVSLRRDAPGDRLAAVVQALKDGPTETEQANAITTALPPDLSLIVVAVQGRRVTLDLSGETDGRSATENVLAVGQIVLSVTALPSVDEVLFSHNGATVEALLADGALTTDPLTADDYASLRSP